MADPVPRPRMSDGAADGGEGGTADAVGPTRSSPGREADGQARNAPGGAAGGSPSRPGRRPDVPSAPATQHPAALLYGPGHVIVHGNPPFRARFGAGCLGLPAAEALLDLPRAAFDLMDLVYRIGRARARWISMGGSTWRLTIAERRDLGTGEVYGIALHLVPREDGDSSG